ncbi:MAG: hypothetical protein LUQ53_04250 [Methanothrix sp.]|jgi:hypothetical protein|nr:hypothetical protein [Methanothrix sp.]
MVVHITDSQVVGEAVGTLFTIIQPAPIDAAIVLKNSGVNTMNYRFQEWNGVSWVDMGASGSDFYNTLSPNETKLIEVESSNPKVQMIGNASGGAFLEFAITRYFNRDSGGAVPILNL